jgi:HAE1 family hydrophobic/amphiphilic exporter-1
MYSGSKTLTVSTDAKFQSVEDVANMLLPLPTGGTVRLGEVAQVALETADADTVARMDGGDCVLLQVSKQSGTNEKAAADAVEARMEELAQRTPASITASRIWLRNTLTCL